MVSLVYATLKPPQGSRKSEKCVPCFGMKDSWFGFEYSCIVMLKWTPMIPFTSPFSPPPTTVSRTRRFPHRRVSCIRTPTLTHGRFMNKLSLACLVSQNIYSICSLSVLKTKLDYLYKGCSIITWIFALFYSYIIITKDKMRHVHI